MNVYRGLWKLTHKFVREESAIAVFLAVNIIFWTVGTVLVGCAVLLAADRVSGKMLMNVLCGGAYAGIIFGLAGGVIFLWRKEKTPTA